MSKVWIAKQWIDQNPPPVGSRVFVGGANGSGHYETINAGETKRILQSNGQGNIFYGNVTVDYPPLEPALESNLPDGDYTGNSVGYKWNFEGGIINENGSITMSTGIILNSVPNTNLKKFSSTTEAEKDSRSSMRVDAPYSYDIWYNQANKITLYIDTNNWAVGELSEKRDTAISAYALIYFAIGLKAVKVNGIYADTREEISTNWRDLTDKCDGTGITVTVVFSKVSW